MGDVSKDFDLDNSEWWNSDNLERSLRHMMTNGESALHSARVLAANFPYNAETAKLLARAETRATEVLLGVQVAKADYDRRQPAVRLVAAE